MVGHVNLPDQLVQNELRMQYKVWQTAMFCHWHCYLSQDKYHTWHDHDGKYLWSHGNRRHRSSCTPQLLRHPFTTMHTYTVTLDIASHQNQIVYIVLSNKMLSKIVQSFCLQSLCCNNEYTPSWHLPTFYKIRGFIDIWCFARLSSRAPRSWREFAKCRFTHFPSMFSLHFDTYVINTTHQTVQRCLTIVV